MRSARKKKKQKIMKHILPFLFVAFREIYYFCRS